MADIIIISIIAIMAFMIIRNYIRKARKGNCCSGDCAGCSGNCFDVPETSQEKTNN